MHKLRNNMATANTFNNIKPNFKEQYSDKKPKEKKKRKFKCLCGKGK